MAGEDSFLLGSFIVLYILFLIVVIALHILIAWRITSKMGYPGVISLLLLLPIVNVVLYFIAAFSEWPIQKELQAYKDATAKKQVQKS